VSMGERETVDVYVLAEAPSGDCADCGEPIEPETRFAFEPVTRGSKSQVMVHDYCAVRNGYDLSAVQGRWYD
jgi:hypothetical protein